MQVEQIHRAGNICGREFPAFTLSGCAALHHLSVFTNLETLGTSLYWDFMEIASHRPTQLLTPFPALFKLYGA